jgi:chromate reductase, NAD(P)H dehydrogenase (quinone)
MKKIFALIGSTRHNSSNLQLVKAIREWTQQDFTFIIFDGLAALPHFNPDPDIDPAPEMVAQFRNAIRDADAVLICTPEYAMGVPGSLKNAIDWTVSSMEFSHKPTALITASTSGLKGHQSLLETLKVIEANITDETQLIISHIKAKMDNSGNVIHEETIQKIKIVMNALKLLIEERV